jgi:hypothetical protein
MLDRLREYGLQGVEMTGGGWSSAPHLRIDELLGDAGKRRAPASFCMSPTRSSASRLRR